MPSTPAHGKRRALLAYPLDLPGGAETILAMTARTLAARPDWSVEVAALGGITPPFVADRIGRARASFGRGGGRLGAEFNLLPRLRNQTFDLVFSTHTRVNAFLSVARRLGALKTRRLVARESTVLADRSRGARLAAYRLLYSVYGAQDLIVAQTGYMADRLRDVLPGPAERAVDVIPNPVDLAAVRHAAAKPLAAPLAERLARHPHVVWCGRLVDIKDPRLALRTLAAVRRAVGVDLRMIMVGEGSLEPALRAEAEALGLADHVTFAGYQPNPYAIMAACPLGLLTSVREGFPNVLLEMMAAGVRGIVTTDCAGDLASLTGVAISPTRDAIDLANALRVSLEGDARGLFEGALSSRNPDVFLDRILGRLGGAPHGPSVGPVN